MFSEIWRINTNYSGKSLQEVFMGKEKRIMQQRERPWWQRRKSYEVLLGMYYGWTSFVKWRVLGRKIRKGLMPHIRELNLTMKAKWRVMTQLIVGCCRVWFSFWKDLSVYIMWNVWRDENDWASCVGNSGRSLGSNLRKEGSDPRLK